MIGKTGEKEIERLREKEKRGATKCYREQMRIIMKKIKYRPSNTERH